MKDEVLNIFSDNTEVLLDQLIENPLLKEIPILGNSINIIKGYIGLRDKLYLSKVKRFLDNLDEYSPKKRERLINESKKSSQSRIKFGESLLTAIEQSDSIVKIDYLSCAFEAFLNNDFGNEDLRHICHAIRTSFVDDLYLIVESEKIPPQILLKHNIASGLVIAMYYPSSFEMGDMEPEYEISAIGMKLRNAWSKYKRN